MMAVIFEDPKPKSTRRWQQRLEPLKRRPGEWARVHVSSTYDAARNYAYSLHSGRYALPPGRFEFQAGQYKEGQGAVYARFLEDES